jgi:cell division protein ZapA
MSDLSIKIKIADREYPMKVKPDEEARVRTAAKEINERYKTYRQQFGIDDKQDLLAMIAFDCLVEKMRHDNQHGFVDVSIQERITRLNQMLNQVI